MLHSRYVTVLTVMVLSCFAGVARAHGGPPAALGIVAASESGPSVVLLNEGLAAQRGDRWSFLCPSLWGENDVSSGKTPLALSADGSQTWIAGKDDLYAAHSGSLTPQHRPDLSANFVTMLASSGDALYGLRIAETGGGSEVVRIGATSEPPMWASESYFSALAAAGDRLYLARQVSDLEIGFVILDRSGQVVSESRTLTDTRSARVEVKPTPSALFAVTYDGLESMLHRFDGSVWKRVQHGVGGSHGPQASPGGGLWIAMNGILMREAGDKFEPTGDARPIGCLGEWHGRPYACVDDQMYWLTDDGLGDRFFDLQGLSGPDPQLVPPSAARECDFQWTLFRNDLQLVGLSPRDWGPSPVAPSAGAGGASAGTGATAAATAGAPSAADGGEVSSDPPGPESSGCSCSAPGATRGGMGASAWAACLFMIALRRRLRAGALLALLVSLAVLAAAGAVLGQSLPAIRADQPSPERRALAVVTYDGGEVTIGELEDAIASSSPLVQQDALQPAALRSLLARSVQFELMAIEAERRGYGERPAVREAIRQNAVHRLLASEVDAKLPPTLQAFANPAPSPERDALIEGLIAELRKTEPSVFRPELLSSIEIESDPELEPSSN